MNKLTINQHHPLILQISNNHLLYFHVPLSHIQPFDNFIELTHRCLDTKKRIIKIAPASQHPQKSPTLTIRKRSNLEDLAESALRLGKCPVDER